MIVQGNALVSLPEDIVGLGAQSMDISNNRLRALPNGVEDLLVTDLFVHGNSLEWQEPFLKSNHFQASCHATIHFEEQHWHYTGRDCAPFHWRGPRP